MMLLLASPAAQVLEPEQFREFHLCLIGRKRIPSETECASGPENCVICPRCRVFPGRCAFRQPGQADLEMAGASSAAGKAAGLDSIAPALPVAGAVLDPGHRSRTHQTCCGLSGGNGPVSWRCRDIDSRGIVEARARRAIVCAHPKQAYADTCFRVAIWLLQTSHRLAQINGGVAIHCCRESRNFRTSQGLAKPRLSAFCRSARALTRRRIQSFGA